MTEHATAPRDLDLTVHRANLDTWLGDERERAIAVDAQVRPETTPATGERDERVDMPRVETGRLNPQGY